MRLLIIALLCCAACAPAGADDASGVYRWKDAQGVTLHGDRAPTEADSERVERRDSAGLDGHVPAPPAAGGSSVPAGFVAPDILMYDSPACGYCRRAERWFDANGLPFRSIDVTASRSNHERFLREGGRATPLILVDGVAVQGFNEQRLRQLVFGQ